MSKQSTAFRLSFYISTAIISVLLVVIIIVYRSGLDLIRENIEKSSISLSSQIITEIRDKVVSTQEIAKNTSSQVPYFSRHNDVEILLKSLIGNYPFIQAIHIDLEKGKLPGSLIKYSVYRRDTLVEYFESNQKKPVCEIEYEAALPVIESGKAGWTEPFVCEVDGEVVSMYCSPIEIHTQEGAVKAGYVSVELSLSFLNHSIQGFKVGKSGFSFLISKEGTYLTHPREEWILTQNIKNLSDSVYKGNKADLAKALLSRKAGSFVAYPRLLDFKKSWVYYTPVPENDWVLIFVMPFSELYHDLWAMLYKLIIISLAGIIIIFFAVSFISKKLMNPLAQIASEIHEFTTAGRLSISKNEVETLEKSYTLIQLWYERFQAEREKNRLTNKQIITDLEQASEIVNNIIPSSAPEFPGKKELDISSSYHPVYLIGGDFYDYFLLDDSHLLITIGDVAGKGISAAMFMGVAHTLLRSIASGMIPRNIVKELNKELFQKNQNQYFLTLFVGVLDLSNGLLNYCSAAHTPSYILKEDGSIVELGGTHGLPLGLYTNNDYRDANVKLSSNDVLFIYTDGITEAADSDGGHYGKNRLKSILKKQSGKSAEEVVGNVEKSMIQFRGNAKQIDDYSIVALKFKP